MQIITLSFQWKNRTLSRIFIWGRGGSTHRGIHCQEPTKGFTDKVVVSYLNIIVVRGKALRPLGSDVNIRAHQRPKVALQLLLNLPQLILYKKNDAVITEELSQAWLPPAYHWGRMVTSPQGHRAWEAVSPEGRHSEAKEICHESNG